MENQVHKISYEGILNPEQVLNAMSQYHVFTLPSSGENFGHAIYEALNAGTPPLISMFTPWGRLQDVDAGVSVDLNTNSIATAIQRFIQYDADEFSRLSSNAFKLAADAFQKNNYRDHYLRLFS
jgi:glycogen synthase